MKDVTSFPYAIDKFWFFGGWNMLELVYLIYCSKVPRWALLLLLFPHLSEDVNFTLLSNLSDEYQFFCHGIHCSLTSCCQFVALTWNVEDLIPPTERYIFNFNSKEELKRWHLYSDSEYGGTSRLRIECDSNCKTDLDIAQIWPTKFRSVLVVVLTMHMG